MRLRCTLLGVALALATSAAARKSLTRKDVPARGARKLFVLPEDITAAEDYADPADLDPLLASQQELFELDRTFVTPTATVSVVPTPTVAVSATSTRSHSASPSVRILRCYAPAARLHSARQGLHAEAHASARNTA